MKKLFLIAAGYVSLALGIAGIFIPLLPTTPFLLLAAACFMKSSEPLYQWIIRHKIFGGYIAGYQQHRAISLRAKAVSIFFLWFFIASSAYFFVPALWPRLLLLSIAVSVTVYLTSLKTLTPEMIRKDEKDDGSR